MPLSLIFLLLLQSPEEGRPPFDVEARAACSATPGTLSNVSGVVVSSVPAQEGDLPALRIAHQPSGAWMLAYYDSSSESAARARADCLGAQLAYLHAFTGDDRIDGEWASVVFTADPEYAAPSGARRWKIATGVEGSITEATSEFLLVTLPHEQVHHFQKRNGAETPRWFHEGHAEWVGRKVSERISPDRAAWDAQEGAMALRASNEPVALQKWGGIQVKREAIVRQVGPEDRRRMETDPSYMPTAPLAFGPDDIVSDESNLSARYEAAWVVFRDLEAARGADAVKQWVNQVTDQVGKISNDAILKDAARYTGADLTERLK